MNKFTRLQGCRPAANPRTIVDLADKKGPVPAGHLYEVHLAIMHVDFLIITALRDELEALRAVQAGWTDGHDQFGLPYYRLLLPNHDGHQLSIVAGWSGEMGEAQAATRSAALVAELRPAAIGMCGICAGNPGETNLGDIVAADRVYSYDHGKLIAGADAQGARIEEFRHDITTYNLSVGWKMAVDALAQAFTQRVDLANERPLALEVQRTWLLRALISHEEGNGPAPTAHPERATSCPDWAKALASLEGKGAITVTGGTLLSTMAGQEFAREHRLRFPDWTASNGPFKAHVAPIATGKTVRQDPQLFQRLERLLRATLGVEMEAAAIGHVARFAEIPVIVVKAVSDHADGDKDDSFRQFACTASAKFLLEFASSQMGPGAGSVEKRLAALKTQWRNDTNEKLAGSLALPRTKAAKELLDATNSHRTTVVLGESGSGKSALLKMVFAHESSAVIAHADELTAMDEEELCATISAWRRPTILIIDAAERLTGERCRRFARVVRSLDLDRDSPWRLVLACQALEWPTTKQRLEETAFAWGTMTSLAVSRLEDAELGDVRTAFPTLQKLMGRKDLRPLVSQPKLLDLLCRAAADDQVPATDRWIGESSFIDWYWEQYFRRDGRGEAHVALIQRIAKDQADRRTFGTPLASLEDASLLEEIQRAGILTSRGDVVRFGHDVYADQARARFLRSQLTTGNHDELRSRVENPLWHRAIRLVGLHLLEADPVHPEDGTRNWSRLRNLLGAPPSRPEVGSDLLLEAIPYAVEPARLLDNLAQDLFAKDGALLRRFLVRFLFVTSIPHPEVLASLVDAARETRAQAEVAYRLPVFSLWLPVLQWVIRNGSRIIELAPDELLAIAEPWILVAHGHKTFPLRAELAEIVLRLGEVAATSPRWERPVRDLELLYRILLLCAREHPDRFRSVARRLAGLVKAEEPAASPPANVAPEKQYLLRRLVRGEPVGPWPGGPVTDSDDAFGRVALSHPGTNSLVEFDPSFAKEIFLGLLIAAPHERDRTGDLHDRELEIRHPDFDFKPTHLFSPVRELLVRAPEVGRTMVVELADFATQRWVELVRGHSHRSPDDSEHDGIDLMFSEGARQYLGGTEAFSWHLAGSNGPTPLTASLMTLEHWLYEQQNAATLDISTLEELLVSTRSVAILGILCEIAVRTPGSLVGVLEPLATSAHLLYWSRMRRTMPLPFAFQVSDESLEFVTMEHRKRDLTLTILYVFAQLGLKWPAIASSYERWRLTLSSLPPSGFRIFLEQLVGHFDPENWTATSTPDGQPGFAFNPSPEMVARHEEGQRLLESVELQGLPFRCRRIIDGDEQLADGDVVGMLDRVRAVQVLDEHASWAVGGIAGLRCAVAAMALKRAPALMDAQPDSRKLCVEWVLAAAEATHNTDDGVNWVDAREWTWDVFAAEVLPLLLAENESDGRLRRALAEMVLFPHGAAVVRLFRSAFERLSRRTFQALIHLGVTFARERLETHDPAIPEDVPSHSRATHEALEAFVADTLGPLAKDWSTLSAPQSSPHVFDEGYLMKVFAWVAPRLRQRADLDVIAPIIESLALNVHSRIRRMNEPRGAQSPTPLRRRDRVRGPDLPDMTLLGWVATLVVIEPSATRRHTLWAPWASLPASFDHWLETFFEAIYRAGLDEAAPHFKESLSEICSYLTTEGWLNRNASSFEVSGPALRLIGRGHTMHVFDRWSANHSDIALGLTAVWKAWIDAAYSWHGCLAAFCDVLRAPAFQGVRAEALRWLDPLDLETPLADAMSQDALVKLLDGVVHDSAREMKQPDLAIVERLLGTLVAVGNKRAIVLSGNLAAARAAQPGPASH
jgi:nucleoside phosphorylase